MLRASPVRRPFSRRSPFFAAALFLCLLPICAAAQSQDSQDVAEAARQEKARKAAAAKKDSHVYTNEDLKRSQILTPEDRVQAEARRKNRTIPSDEQPADSLDAAAPAPKTSESLGEVARRYRRDKTAREAEQALKNPPHIALPSDLSQPALASPRPLRAQPITPLTPSGRPPRPALAPPSGRRDPFSRPPYAFSPAAPSRTHSTVPAPPRISSKALAPVTAIAPGARAPRAPLSAEPHTGSPHSSAAQPKVEPHPLSLSERPVAPNHPQPGPVPPSAGGARITVQPGDSLWKLARLHLGKGSRWHDFLAVNPSLSKPDLLRPGVALVVPVPSSAPVSAQPGLEHTTLKVQSGDSLWKLAASHFGSGTRWLCLAQANPQLLDANRIYPGQALSLPAHCGSTP